MTALALLSRPTDQAGRSALRRLRAPERVEDIHFIAKDALNKLTVPAALPPSLYPPRRMSGAWTTSKLLDMDEPEERAPTVLISLSVCIR